MKMYQNVCEVIYTIEQVVNLYALSLSLSLSLALSFFRSLSTLWTL